MRALAPLLLLVGCRFGFDEQVSQAIDARSGAIDDGAGNSPDGEPISGAPAVMSMGNQTTSGSNNNFVTVTTPANIVAGDLLVAVIGPENATTMTLAGWTPIFNGSREVVLYKIAGASEPATFTFTGSANMYFSAGMLAIRGANQTSPLDSGPGAATTASSRTAPGLTTSVDSELLLGCFGNALGGDQSLPMSMTEVLDAHTSLTAAMCGTEVRSTEGPTGTRMSSGGGGGPYTAELIAVMPSSATGGASP